MFQSVPSVMGEEGHGHEGAHLPSLVASQGRPCPDKLGFVDVNREGVRYSGTFGSHVERVCRLAYALRGQLGIEREDRYAVLAVNGHEFIELYHAALFGAGIVLPVNIRFSPAELAYVLGDSGATVVFTDPVFSSLLNRACDEEGAKVDKIVMIGGEDARDTGRRFGCHLLRGPARVGASPPYPPSPKSTIPSS